MLFWVSITLFGIMKGKVVVDCQQFNMVSVDRWHQCCTKSKVVVKVSGKCPGGDEFPLNSNQSSYCKMLVFIEIASDNQGYEVQTVNILHQMTTHSKCKSCVAAAIMEKVFPIETWRQESILGSDSEWRHGHIQKKKTALRIPLNHNLPQVSQHDTSLKLTAAVNL